MADRNIGFNLNFKANTKDVDASLNKLKQSLQGLSKMKLVDFKGTATQFDEMKQTVQQIGIALEKSFNPTLNTTNIERFQQELQGSAGSLDQIYSKLSVAGPAGQVAFHQMATQVLTTNLQLKETHSLIDSMGKTMMNTVKWGIASSIMNTFTQSVQGAFSYVQSLQRSLTNIRIVTGDSTQQMARFADQANRAAQELGRSTLDYTKSSLTFYQQGLDEEAVQARTEATLKAQNITGTGAQMADYLTSVWNGYKVANEQAQIYVDKLAAVADSSASDMSQLAIAMSKVASVANTMGVDIDQLNAQIATVVATTRQAPESVGTAFKTIYTRMNDIKTGSEEAEISLGNYSGQMATLGFNVLDANGHLRDTGQVIEEIGERWSDLSREQQVYLSRIMGGQRQVNQLMALFDNWTTYSELLNTSLESQGTLNEKNARYMESLGAKMEQLGAAGERVKAALIDENTVKGGVDALTNLVNLLGSFIEGIGGGNNALLAFGSIATQIFGGTISRQINNVFANMQQKALNMQQIQKDIQLTGEYGRSKGYSEGVITELIAAKQAGQQYYNVMSEGEINHYNQLVQSIAKQQQQTIALQASKEAAQAFQQQVTKVSGIDLQKDGFGAQLADDIQIAQERVQRLGQDFGVVSQQVQTEFNNIAKSIGGEQSFAGLQTYQNLKDVLNDIAQNGNNTTQTVFSLRTAWNSFTNELKQTSNNAAGLSQIKADIELTKAKLEGAKSEAELFRQSMERLSTVKSITTLVSSLGQVATILNNLTNIGRIIKDDDISAGEKLRQILTNVGFTLPLILNVYKNFSNLLGITALKEQKRTLQLKKQTLELLKQEAIKNGGVLNAKNIKNFGYEEVKKQVAAVADYQNQIDGIDQKLAGMATSGGTAFASLKAGASSFMGALTPLLPYILAIGAVVAVGYGLYKAYNSAADAAKQAAESAKQAKQQYDKLKESFHNLLSAIEDYHNARDALDDLVKGTSQWYDKVNEVNDKVLELLKNYPELAKYIHEQNGILTLSPQGEEQVKNTYRTHSYAAGLAYANAQRERVEAENRSRIVDEGRRILGAGGMVGGVYDFSRLISAMQREGENVLADQGKLINLGFNQEQIAALQDNTDAILQLYHSIENEQDRVKTLNDSINKASLAGEKEYQSSKNKDIFADIFSSRMSQYSSKLGDQYYKTRVDTYTDNQTGSQTETGVTKIESQVLDRKKLFEEYKKITGQAIEQGWLGGLKKVSEDGSKKKIQLDDVIDLVARESAAQNKEEVLKEVAELDNKISELSQENRELLAKSGLAGGQKNANLQNLSRTELEQLKTLDPELLKQILKTDDINTVFEELGTQIDGGINSFINNIKEDDIRQTLRTLYNNKPFGKELSESLLQDVASNLKETQTKTGKDVSQFFRNVFDEKNFKGIQDALNFDFFNGSFEDFISMLDQAGVAIQENKDIIKEYYEAQKEKLQIDSKEARTDPTKVANGSTTLGLLQKQASGENLSTKEIQALESGVKGLIQLYPELTKEIQILNETGLVGTRAYEESLRKLKLAFVSSYQEMLGAGTITTEEIANQMSAYIKTSEDLQMVRETSIFGQQEYSKKLELLANNYESCKDQLQKYIIALQTANEETQKAAEYNLELALRAAQNGEKYGIQAERISDLAKHYAELGAAGNETYAGLEKNAELASDAAVRYIRLNQSIEDLQKNLTSVSQVLQILSSENGLQEVLADDDLSKTFETIKSDVAGILDTSQELIDADFIKQYAQQIKEAAGGSEEAVEALRKAFTEEWIANVNIDDEKFFETLGKDKEEFVDWLNALPEGEIVLDDLAAIQSLVTLLEEAGYTKDQIEDLFSAANINLDLGYPDTTGIEEAATDAVNTMVDAGNNIASTMGQAGANASNAFASTAGIDVEQVDETTTKADNMEIAGFEAEAVPMSHKVSLPLIAASNTLLGAIPQIVGTAEGQISYAGVNVKPKTQDQETQKTNTATGLRVKGANKASGGQISHKNKTGGNKKGSGGKGGKGGGGKGSQPKAPKTAKGVTVKTDPYRTVNNNLKRTGTQLEKVRKEQEKLAGKDLIDNLTKQQKILDEQVELYKEKLAIAKQERDTIASTLNQNLAGTGVQLQFDQNGTIQNMQQVMQAAARKANDQIARYNRMSAEQQEKDANKNIAKNAETWFKNIQTLLSNYDKLTEDTIPGLEKDIQDQLEKQLELNLQKFNLQIDLTLDAGQAKRQYDQFKKDILDSFGEDNIRQNNEYLKTNIESYVDENQALEEHIRKIQERIRNMQAGQFDSVYGRDINKAISDLDKYTDSATKNLEDIKKDVEDLRDSIFDAIDQVTDKFEQQQKEFDYIGDVIEHGRKLTELMYGDDAFEQMDKFYEQERKNNNQQLEFQYGQTQVWYNKMLEAKDQLDKASNDREREYWEKQLKEYEKLYLDCQKELNDTFEKSIENIIDKFVNAIETVFDKTQKAMTGGLGFDFINDEWDLINKNTDRYLDKVDALYEIDSLDQAYRDAIKNAEGNPKAQQALNNLMNTQLQYLRDKDKLTKYDVDRANALLNIEVKRLAIENARNNKSKLRLRRDSQGNYTYQYVADDSDVNKAEQDLAKARVDLFDMTRDSLKDSAADLIDNVTDMQSKYKEIMEDVTLDAEEKQRRLQILGQQYGKTINDILSEVDTTSGFIAGDMLDSLSQSLHEIIALSDKETNDLLNAVVPQLGSSLFDAIKNISENGLDTYMNEWYEGYERAHNQFEQDRQQAQAYSNQSLDYIVQTTQDLNAIADNLLRNNQELLNENKQFIDQINQQIAQAVQDAMSGVNESLAGTAGSALETSQNFLRASANIQEAIKQLNEAYYLANNEKASGEDVNNVNKSVQEVLSNGIATYATGGHTGSWGETGKLAVLHEKELVLNAEDTSRILSAVDIVRTIDNLLSNIDFNNQIMNGSIIPVAGVGPSTTTDQNIHIEAHFPNVSMHNQIEKAFENLVNQAYQYAYRRK